MFTSSDDENLHEALHSMCIFLAVACCFCCSNTQQATLEMVCYMAFDFWLFWYDQYVNRTESTNAKKVGSPWFEGLKEDGPGSLKFQ